MGVACLEFRGENFRGWLKNREIRERFLPRKFPAIRYYYALSSCIQHVVTLSQGVRVGDLVVPSSPFHSIFKFPTPISRSLSNIYMTLYIYSFRIICTCDYEGKFNLVLIASFGEGM